MHTFEQHVMYTHYVHARTHTRTHAHTYNADGLYSIRFDSDVYSNRFYRVRSDCKLYRNHHFISLRDSHWSPYNCTVLVRFRLIPSHLI